MIFAFAAHYDSSIKTTKASPVTYDARLRRLSSSISGSGAFLSLGGMRLSLIVSRISMYCSFTSIAFAFAASTEHSSIAVCPAYSALTLTSFSKRK